MNKQHFCNQLLFPRLDPLYLSCSRYFYLSCNVKRFWEFSAVWDCKDQRDSASSDVHSFSIVSTISLQHFSRVDNSTLAEKNYWCCFPFPIHCTTHLLYPSTNWVCLEQWSCLVWYCSDGYMPSCCSVAKSCSDSEIAACQFHNPVVFWIRGDQWM